MTDQFSLLDSTKLLREIDDEIDGNVFDHFSFLSPERTRQQLADNDIVISNVAMLDPARFADEVEIALTNEGGDGGGDLPDPPNGFAYIVNADGEYLVNDDDAYILAKV